jgi:hypothetical protein
MHRTNTLWSVEDIEESPRVVQHSEERQSLQVCIEQGKKVSLGKLERLQED